MNGDDGFGISDAGSIGLTGAVSMALGGMIGGGIYAVMGVVVQVSGAASWTSFVLAGVVAMCAGYSYVSLNQVSHPEGASPTYLEWFKDQQTLAGMAGWSLLLGYVGSMAMYAYAFGSYFVGMVGVQQILGIPLRPFLSAFVVAAFVALNLAGVEESNWIEIALVVFKIAVLLGFVAFGLVFAAGHGGVRLGLDAGVVGVEPLMAAAVSFVAFQGWQLLMYSQETIENHGDTNPVAIFISIPTAVVIYVGVAIVTVSLVDLGFIAAHPETALAIAARRFAGGIGHFVISLSALVSTASAINATLFTSTQFSDRLIDNGQLPDVLAGSVDAEDVEELDPGADDDHPLPKRVVLLLGGLSVAFTVYGSLQGITSFASLTFIVVFGAMSYLAFEQRDHEEVSAVPPAVGAVGAAVFLPLMLWHLYDAQPGVFYTVVAISVVALLAELAYFELAEVRALFGEE